MKYDEEIQKLHARVEQLEKMIAERIHGVTAPALDAITDEYLDTLTQDQIIELLQQGRITPAQFGAAFAGVQIKSQLNSKIADLETQLGKLSPASEDTAKSSGDDKDAGDWTKAGDGTDYPAGSAVSPTPSSPAAEQAAG